VCVVCVRACELCVLCVSVSECHVGVTSDRKPVYVFWL